MHCSSVRSAKPLTAFVPSPPTRNMDGAFARATPLPAFQQVTPLPRLSTVAPLPCPCRQLRACHPSMSTQHRVGVPMSRRAALHALALASTLPLLPAPARARRAPKEPLSSSLIPLVRVHDSLKDLSADVSAGTNGDVRRVIKVVLAGNDVVGSARKSALWLEAQSGETAERHAREAFEYLNQVVEYFDATATKERPRSEVLKFCQMAIDAAGAQLDETLALFEQAQVEQARIALGA